MATKNDGVTNGCIFQWKIKNITHSSSGHKQRILSPAFVADALKSTKWSLWLYPWGYTDMRNVSFYLRREEDYSEPGSVDVHYQLAFLDEDGLFLEEIFKSTQLFSIGNFGDEAIAPREKIFVTKREVFLPEDTLTVQCSIWDHGKTPVEPKYLSAKTVFKVNRTSFVWKVDNFSKLKSSIRKNYKDDLIVFDLVCSDLIDFVKKLDIDIISYNETLKMLSIKISIINSRGEKECSGNIEYSTSDLKKGVLPMPLFSKKLLENKTKYLWNDELLLHCEYVSSDGAVSYELSGYGAEMSSEVMKIDVEKESPQQMLVLAKDLKVAYSDGIHSDVELITSTKTFPVHKFILSARSPVFRKMFSNDMKEKNSGHVDITDLDDDTIHRMLLYMYTDTLEDLQLASAYRLYVAADKYEIMCLRSRCSYFLKDNLTPSKACTLMDFADQHHDDDLKSVIQNYMLKNSKEIFNSQEWKDFMDTNPKLAANIMFRKLFPG